MDIPSVVFGVMQGPQLDSGALVMLGIGALIIWAIMHFVLSDKYSENIIIFVDSVRSYSPVIPETHKPTTKDEADEALRKKKARQRRREFARRAIATAKRAAGVARDCLWMVAVSVAIILTTVLLVYTR